MSKPELFLATVALLTSFNLAAFALTFLAARTSLLDRFLDESYVEPRRLSGGSRGLRKRVPLVLLNMAWTTLFGAGWAAFATQAGALEPMRVAVEATVVIAIYHGGFYALHRLQHWPGLRDTPRWRWIAGVHARHHSVRQPYAMDFLYENPVDIALAAVVIFAGMVVLAPFSAWSYWLVLVHHNVAGILDHSGLRLHRSHFLHHNGEHDANYGVLAAGVDAVMGTRRG